MIFYTDNLVRDLATVTAVAAAPVLGYLAALRLIQLAPALIAAYERLDFSISFSFSFAFF